MYVYNQNSVFDHFFGHHKLYELNHEYLLIQCYIQSWF